ncbi:TPA: hypothetical protein ACRRC6_000454 [Klebsiella pneumoniae]|uniref:hypothetical protein n=1 Tax=Klebsiella TaxID=570 RepID=UPI0007CCD635|nr:MULTISPECIES: hypothetical protein [Klebsiella]HDS4802065.1 hypothetical protein [Klebsiella pneumoniae subsp. ozaenae]MBC5029530.1 hypothetical protein [Klebsiella pneumoniae]MCB3427618.1 hypothetical protein [Klebsiella pneumoniae]MCF0404340.1 hypothetical protein [Klebsiella pneumoniae]MCP3183825.1 hypothetical protein [Klebsiella pneumoniae]
MTTDITELALRLKLEVHRAVSNFNPQMNIKTRDLKELVEALEKAHAVMNAVVTAAAIRGVRPFDGIDCDPPTLEENAEACGDAMSARIRELEANPPKPHHNGLMQISNELTLEQAIQHTDEKAAALSGPCAEQHKQLAEWLRVLQERRKSAELESRTVRLPKERSATEFLFPVAVYPAQELTAALTAQGIKVEAE